MSTLSGVLTELQNQLAPRFNPACLPPAIFQFHFDDGESCYLVVEQDRFQFLPDDCQHPSMTLFVDNHATLAGLLTGSIDGMDAFMAGRYRSDGNIVLSQLLLHAFRAEDAAVFYEVRD
jgi:putative sterol carrier protein